MNEKTTEGVSNSKEMTSKENNPAEILPRIKEDMDPASIKFPAIDKDGNKTGELVTLDTLLVGWAKHEDQGRSLSNTLGSFACEVALSNKDIDVAGQIKVFKALCFKAADKAFPKLVAKDEFGGVLYGPDMEPRLVDTTPQSYKVMVASMVTLWSGKHQTKAGKERKDHDPIIPGTVYEVYDGRKKAYEKRVISTLGQMQAVERTMKRRVLENKARKALTEAKEKTTKLIGSFKAEGFEDDTVKGAIEKAKEISEIPKGDAKEIAYTDVQVEASNLEKLLAARRLQKLRKDDKPTSEDDATPSEQKAAIAVAPKVDNATGVTVPVNTETGAVHLDAIGLERHLSGPEAARLKYIGILLANLEGAQRKRLYDGLAAVINTCLSENPQIDKRVQKAIKEAKAS